MLPECRSDDYTKNLWGFDGDRIWSSLCQIDYNLKKFLQLYRNEELPESCLIRLGLLT